ncbi:insulin-degrading enzyme isoform X2 [Diorhabda carinulata]|uniref:insulin-degrading enzyme isoform X2 n=1 Tax=Diorhabda sublineata TaxID=1163346 RepID=UPI0024E17478|nr:insulin-degrading enzyme isoform X2 [Diorhabda sublineata]XP_057662372.1 insulin-degrading enzyme isoform X2 [Diorhabda carinulata]
MYCIRQTILFVKKFSSKKFKPTVFLYSTAELLKETKLKMNKSPLVLKRYDNITKSDEDQRLYRGLELSNHMKILLVSDPKTDKSSAAMDVNVGFLSDPKEVYGLAHFCEHMLFLGTKKYPNENDYSKFLSEHGGSSNAATYLDHTLYYFDVIPDKLSQALDRFSQFFIAPLFTESATEREINAVNSEHEKNIPNDLWRLDQLNKHLANPDHPFNTFGTGNKDTLLRIPKENNIDVREKLLEFHEKWYSSNIMSLAVLGKESLDELEEMVVELFSGVSNHNVKSPEWKTHPFTDDQFQTIVYVSPVKDVRNLNIIFPTEDFTEHYKSSPSHYISHLMGHEGPGSILSVLKARGWSNSLVAGNKPAPRGIGFFAVAVDLTEEGINHVDEIVELVFQYLNMLKREGPQKWVQDENRDIAQMIFRFKDKESPRGYISSLVHSLQEYPMEDVLYANYMLNEWRPDLVEDTWKNFVPEKVRISVIAKKFEKDLDEKEPWYGTKYRKEKIPDATIQRWKEAGLCPDLKMPEKNEFIPNDFSLYPIDEDVTEFPVIVEDTALTRVWFKQDDQFLLPKANLMCDFVSPLAYLDPLNCNLTHMLVQLFKDALNEYAYAAELAGLKWELINTKYGLILGIGGYNNKQHIFLQKIMEKLTNFKIDPKRFNIIKETYVRNLKNFAAEQPYQHAVYYLTVLLTEHSWTKQELLAAVDQMTIERLEAFIPQILSKMHIECLIHGNANKEKALELVRIIEDSLTSSMNMSPLLPRQLLLNRELKLEDGCQYSYEVKNDVHKSSCVELYYQCGLQSKENNMKLELVAQILQEPCFNILRTKEQLGYIVFSGVRRSNGVQGLRIIVQSDRHPNYLDSRIEAFLDSMLTQIIEMSEEDFVKHREAWAAQRLEKPKQLNALTNRFWSEITTQQYHFDRANVEVAYLRSITKNDIIEFYKEMLSSNAEKRKKLSVQVVSVAEGGAGLNSTENSHGTCKSSVINDVTVFKSSHEMYPLVQPYINITRKGNKCKL